MENPAANPAESARARERHLMTILRDAMLDPALSGGCPLLGQLFATIAEEHVADALLTATPEWKIPSLLLSAALLYRAAANAQHPLAGYLPDAASPLPIDATFRAAARRAIADDQSALAALMQRHTYQCNPPRRMAVSLIAIAAATAAWEPRPARHIDVGTASGIGLLLGQVRALAGTASLGPTDAALQLPIELRGTSLDLRKLRHPQIEQSIGIDLDPPDLRDAQSLAWMRACQFPLAAEWAYFDRAVELLLHQRPRIERGSATDILPQLAADMPAGQPLIVTDSYVAVFMTEEDRERLRQELDHIARLRPVVWISNNALVPLDTPDRTTAGTQAAAALVERNSRALFGAVCATTWRHGKRTPELVGIAHPGGCWLEWGRPA